MGWDIEQSKRLFNMGHWDNGYFSINPEGFVVANPLGDRTPAGAQINLTELCGRIRHSGLQLPVLVRFLDILRDRVDRLCGAFEQAMNTYDFGGGFSPLYPIKVNQQRSVVETLIGHDNGRVGLEAGSKPELMAVLALAPEGGLIVCNGYKDREFIRLALIGIQLGHRVFIVIEKPNELALVLEESRKLGIEPLLGIRTRLASIGYGKWQNTGGEKGKFGLSAGQVIQVIDTLSEAGLLHTLKLLHMHLGSQIPNIRDIRNGIGEGARYYAELRRAGAGVEYFDVGGGLGVDYEGTRSRNFCSVNYTLQEYANTIIHVLGEVCVQNALPHPRVLTESGRALTAHHAVLISNIINTEHAQQTFSNGSGPDCPDASSPKPVHDLWEVLNTMEQKPPMETYHEATHFHAEVQNLFGIGMLNLQQRADGEYIYHTICHRIRERLDPALRSHREISDELNDKLAAKYFCNFSLFQSLPDAWAINQVFPVIPLQRLDEQPSVRGVIEDLTCDSDGRIKSYVSDQSMETTMPLHPLSRGETYLVGMFMVGAYQEILGDLHNLFGDTNSIDVLLDDKKGYMTKSPKRGDTVSDVLRTVNIDAQYLLEALHTKAQHNQLDSSINERYIRELEEGLRGYTYFEE